MSGVPDHRGGRCRERESQRPWERGGLVEKLRRQVGIIWDIVTMWPRHHHPFAPPPYARRAVDELTWRGERLSSEGTSFILAGHSQGSLLCTIAAKRLESCDGLGGLEHCLVLGPAAARADRITTATMLQRYFPYSSTIWDNTPSPSATQ